MPRDRSSTTAATSEITRSSRRPTSSSSSTACRASGSETAYRTFRAEVAEDRWPPAGPGGLEAAAESFRQLVLELSTRLPPESGALALAEAVAQIHDPSAAVDLVAAAAVSEPEARQAVLEELDVERRLERVVSEVAAVVLLLSRGKNLKA